MTARVFLPVAGGPTAVIEAERRADRLGRCWRDRMPVAPDALLHEVIDLLADQGVDLAPGAPLRAFFRRIQKTAERGAP
jgi:hypothetical protein